MAALSERGDSKRYRIVVADDHPDMRQEIRGLLDCEFEVVRAVADGAALIAAAQEEKPDAVISDIQMPVMDGIEAGRQILGRGLCRAFVVLSMYSDRHLVETALKAGVRGYVLKLDACDELISAVHSALRGECYLSARVRTRHKIKNNQ